MLKIFKKHIEIVILFIIFFIGLFFRTYKLKDNFIFSYDQARDSQRIYQMIYNKDIKLVGPETDIPGVFNGVFYYYILLIFYWISNFDLNLVLCFFSILNLLNIFILYDLSIILFKDKKVGLISAFLWTVSFAQMNNSRYLSNASFMSMASLILFYGLARFIFKKDKRGLLISAIGFGLSIHFNFYLIYLILAYFFVYIFFNVNKKQYIRDLVEPFFVFLFIMTPFIISLFKYDFIAVKSLLDFFKKDTRSFVLISDSLHAFLQRFSEANYYSFCSFNSFLSLVFFGFLFFFCKKQLSDDSKFRFLSLWVFSTFPLFGFNSGVLTVAAINTTIFPALTLIVAGGIFYFFKKHKEIFVGLIVFILISNMMLWFKNKFLNTMMISITPLLYKDEKAIVDYTYKSSKGQPFSICAVSEPLFINVIWSYLYKVYGEKTYGYIPFWTGPKQEKIKSFLPLNTKEKNPKFHFLILSYRLGIPELARKLAIASEDRYTKLIEEKQFGNFKVQKRVLLSEEEIQKKLQEQLKENFNIKNREELIQYKNNLNTLNIEPRYNCFNLY